MHFTVNMHYTKARFAISRVRLFRTGLARPFVIAIPSLILIHFWWLDSAPAIGPQAWLAWGLCTLLLAWFAGLTTDERGQLVRLAGRRPQHAYKL